MSDIKVIDFDYVERDFEFAQSKYGVAFRRAEVAPGQKVYRLTEMWEKTGTTAIISQVLGEDGEPMADVDVAFYWPDAPDPPDPPTSLHPHDWHPRFVHGLTNAEGEVGPSMGNGAYHGEGEGGPHAVWVRDPDVPSDICEKLGMLAGTFHDHLDLKFRLTVESEDGGNDDGEPDGNGDAPPPDQGDSEFVLVGDARFENTEGTNRIIIELAEGQARDFYDTRVDLRVGNDPNEPDYEYPQPFGPIDLQKYSLNVPYDPGEEDSRIFQVCIRHASTEEALSGWMPFAFTTNQYGIHHATVAWKVPGEPSPTPEPPLPDNLADLMIAVADTLVEMVLTLDSLTKWVIGAEEKFRRIGEVLGGSGEDG